MSCQYCGWTRDTHAQECPVKKSSNEEEWQQGWSDGRSGKVRTMDSVAYLMGWVRGISAMEETTNGHDPRF